MSENNYEAGTYYGWRDEKGHVFVTVNGHSLRHIEYHSPDGFEWGYQGSAPADLALAILAHYFREWHLTSKRIKNLSIESEDDKKPKCLQYHQRFKEEIIAKLPRRESWTITHKQITDWFAEVAKSIKVTVLQEGVQLV